MKDASTLKDQPRLNGVSDRPVCVGVVCMVWCPATYLWSVCTVVNMRSTARGIMPFDC